MSIHDRPPPHNTDAGPKTPDFEVATFWAMWLIDAWSGLIFAFIRRRFGRQFFNLPVWSGLVLLWLWACYTVLPNEMEPHFTMGILFMVLAIWHKVTSRDIIDGHPVHSRYNGYPIVCSLLPVSEKIAKLIVEPLLLFLISYLIMPFSPSLGKFIAIGTVFCVLHGALIRDRFTRRARQLRDARLEHQATIDIYNEYLE